MKVMETMNVVIDESSDSSFEKFSEEIPKRFFLPSLGKFKKLLNKSSHLQVLPVRQVL